MTLYTRTTLLRARISERKKNLLKIQGSATNITCVSLLSFFPSEFS